MRKNFVYMLSWGLVLLTVFSASACRSSHKQDLPPSAETAAANTAANLPEKSAPQTPEATKTEAISNPAVKQIIFNTKQAVSNTKQAVSAPQAAPQKPAVSASENTPNPAEENGPTAADLIQQARINQTFATPQPDTPVFKKEDSISLNGRYLNPFAYEPVKQTQTAAPWSQEQLKYGVYYSFIKAGTAIIKNRGITTVNGRKAYLIQTTAFSAAAIDTVFKVRDINYSWLDAENFYSLGYTQSLREGNYVRDEWVIFDYPHKRYYGEVKKKDEPRAIDGPLTEQVLDMLTSLYYVRAQELEIGKDVVFDIINREEKYPLVVKVIKKETIKTAAGKFDCILVEPQFRGEGIFVSKGKNLKVWLTDDKYKMPVKMQTEVFIGSVSAELLEYSRN